MLTPVDANNSVSWCGTLWTSCFHVRRSERSRPPSPLLHLSAWCHIPALFHVVDCEVGTASAAAAATAAGAVLTWFHWTRGNRKTNPPPLVPVIAISTFAMPWACAQRWHPLAKMSAAANLSAFSHFGPGHNLFIYFIHPFYIPASFSQYVYIFIYMCIYNYCRWKLFANISLLKKHDNKQYGCLSGLAVKGGQLVWLVCCTEQDRLE